MTQHGMKETLTMLSDNIKVSWSHIVKISMLTETVKGFPDTLVFSSDFTIQTKNTFSFSLYR